MLTAFTSVRKTALLLFIALSACYVGLSPATTQARGYVYDDMQSGMRLLASFNAWVKGRPVPPVEWTRHGPLSLLLDLPFIKIGKLFVSPDFVLSLQPVLLTAGLLTILYLWLRRLCSPAVSLLLTLIGAFSTMLWPYAYIGLETKQSFFVFLAGYLALADGKIRGWPRLLLFSTAAGFALTAKSVGTILWPAMAYLVYVQFRSDWRARRAQALAVVLIISGIWALGILGQNLFWSPIGGGAYFLGQWIIDSPFQFFTNLIGLFGSPGKGLFIFAPALLVSLYAVPSAFSTNRDTVIFVTLVTVCTVAFLCVLIAPADEVWGPRFMHVTVAPLLLLIGAAWLRFRWQYVTLLLLGGVGLVISFLGAFFYYGERGFAATAAGQNTLEWFAGDNVWNEVRFDGRLFRVWLQGGTAPVPWTPAHIWAWTAPADAQPWKTVNLRDYAEPQSFLLMNWKIPLEGPSLLIFRICLFSLVLGPVLLAWLIMRTIKITAAITVTTAPILKAQGTKRKPDFVNSGRQSDSRESDVQT